MAVFDGYVRQVLTGVRAIREQFQEDPREAVDPREDPPEPLPGALPDGGDAVFSTSHQPHQHELKLLSLREKLTQELKNSATQQPYQDALYYHSLMTTADVFTEEDQMTHLAATSLGQMRHFHDSLFGGGEVNGITGLRCLVYGNVLRAGAVRLTETIHDTLTDAEPADGGADPADGGADPTDGGADPADGKGSSTTTTTSATSTTSTSTTSTTSTGSTTSTSTGSTSTTAHRCSHHGAVGQSALVPPPSSKSVVRLPARNPAEKNSALVLSTLVGRVGDYSTMVALDLLMLSLSNAAYDQLRTTEQLGYIVFQSATPSTDPAGAGGSGGGWAWAQLVVQGTREGPDAVLQVQCIACMVQRIACMV
jgi:hypothetical protein